MTLILQPCQTCPGQMLDFPDGPRCAQCGRDGQPPKPAEWIPEGNVRFGFDVLRWKGAFPVHKSGRGGGQVNDDRFVTLDYYIMPSGNHKLYAWLLDLVEWPAEWGYGASRRRYYVRAKFHKDTGYVLRGLTEAIQEAI